MPNSMDTNFVNYNQDMIYIPTGGVVTFQAVTPEPSTLVSAGIGVMAMLWYCLRRRGVTLA